jgi:(E)-4-hydroxy-3-methylbut-2-enyl-diphosphate synthase
MTNTFTRDVEATCAQLDRMVHAGCEIVRVAVPTHADTAALPEIVRRCPVPVVADVHFHFQRALEAINAGVAKIRLNPGNITDRDQVQAVIAACKKRHVAIRVGVNQGSIGDGQDACDCDSLARRMTDRLRDYVDIFESNRFDNLVLSAKCHDPAAAITVYRAVSRQFDYPIHLGLTHAGDVLAGSVRSATCLGALLAEGIGDTIRISLAGDPVTEVEVAWEMLTGLHLRPRHRPYIIACPTCGRTEIDLLDMLQQVKAALAEIRTPITVAVMGCVVNGPGEAAGADVALCGGRERVIIYRRGQKVATVPAAHAVDALLAEVHRLLAEPLCNEAIPG